MLLNNSDPIRYLIYGYEVGKEGTPHLQGYLELSKVMRITGVKKLPGFERAHIEKRQGTRDQAVAYCKKDGKYTEAGSWAAGGQGSRNDLRKICEDIKKGVPLQTMIEDDTYDRSAVIAKNLRFIDRYTQLVEKEQTKEFRKVETHVLVGDAGTGKSRIARELAGDYFVVNPDDAVPFDGYNGEKALIIDDFYGGIKYGWFLNILDGHQQRINVKYGHRYAKWTTIFITSNKQPQHWYQYGLTPALERRLTTVTMFDCNEEGGNTDPLLSAI